MNLIALVDKKWGIANKGRELVDIPEDKKLFREETYGKVVIMGRKTLEALPNQSALVGRKNILIKKSTRRMKRIFWQTLTVKSYTIRQNTKQI